MPLSAWDFSDEILAECPRCGAGATVRRPEAYGKPARLACPSCGLQKERSSSNFFPNNGEYEGKDPFFGLPLWLRDRAGRHVVWAYNWRHLEDLQYFLAGEWRMHRHLSSESRLTFSYRPRYPRWMFEKRNQPALLRALERIRRKRS